MSLPERYRTALYLFYYEELTVNEIAALLRVKPSAVTTRLSRARQKLKTKLTEVWNDEE
jgi:RNA polymerase sigma-70 factor (ECF subfamily)